MNDDSLRALFTRQKETDAAHAPSFGRLMQSAERAHRVATSTSSTTVLPARRYLLAAAMALLAASLPLYLSVYHRSPSPDAPTLSALSKALPVLLPETRDLSPLFGSMNFSTTETPSDFLLSTSVNATVF